MPLTLNIVCIALAYIVWQCLLRLQKLASPAEPPALPYWIPWIGHTLGFITDSHDTLARARKYFENALHPFSILIGGRKTYVVLNPKDVSETYKRTKDLSYDTFVDQVIGFIGASHEGRNKMWSATVEETKLSVPNTIRAWVRHDLQRGPRTIPLYSNFLDQVHQVLSVNEPPPPNPSCATTQKQVGQTGKVSLLDWTGDTVVTAFTNALFGRACLDNSPEMLEAFHKFNRKAWAVLFGYPKFLSPDPHVGKDAVVSGLAKYFDLPAEQKTDSTDFVGKSLAVMRANGMATRDIAAVLFNVYWALNGNPSLLAFWLLCHMLYNPSLLSDIRNESAKAFINGKQSAPDTSVLFNECPKLNTAFHEALRIYGGASTFRRVAHDTVIGGYTFKAGSDVIMPHRQLHLDEAFWGPDAGEFNIQRFLDNPDLVKSKVFKSFGGGVTHCPGRHVAKEALITYIAIAINRYEFEVVGGLTGQGFPRMDMKAPALGIIAPIPGQDVKVIVRSLV
ncbi:hypothetical protein AJ80_01465 [Polytolypa hystricis UAMH7299]|uniref:Cytochrome P450 n=1 Tax=Polytolypa hystricis (strain UAMH7299) TaxID=1447883 RepID=A0A2B7Z0Y0_POLH7|nr:hypothetical protein AJ80_01465 [Polytolypa hystricis UAMH7299]